MFNKHGARMRSHPQREKDKTQGFVFSKIANNRNGWGATIVDALDTLLIAGFHDEFLAALNFTLKIDFTTADGVVDPFETIIRCVFLYLLIRRYVGGMVSTVDLLEFFQDAPAVDPEIRTALRNQTEVLVGKLAPGYIFRKTILMTDLIHRVACGFLVLISSCQRGCLMMYVGMRPLAQPTLAQIYSNMED
jgi:hypothetical protein